MKSSWNTTIASTFADPADIRAFKHAKARGMTDEQAFRVGDNGIGCWGDDTTAPAPMVALPPEDWRPLGKRARGALVEIRYGHRRITAELRDTMPHKIHIQNGAGIDLNPTAAQQLDLPDGGMVSVEWRFRGNPGSQSYSARAWIAGVLAWIRKNLIR